MLMDLSKYHNRIQDMNLRPYRGSVVRVTGMVVESRGPAVSVGQLCEIRLSDKRRLIAEVVGFQEDLRILLPLEGVEGITPGAPVLVRSTPRYITLGDGLLGRTLDGLGNPIDGLGALQGSTRKSLDRASMLPLDRAHITQPLEFGIRVLDGILTCGKGQRMGIFSGSGVGKSRLLGEIARASKADVNVVALIGERGREVREFLERILGPEGLARSVVVVATADASPIQRVKGAFTAITIAEHFRDQGKDVLFLMDSLTRLAQAQREIGLAAGEPPTTRGYCPSVFAQIPKLTERLGCCESGGSITGILSVLVDGDDMNEPIADCARSLLDGHIVLSRELAQQGHYPAVDILQSVSRLMDSIVSKEHLESAKRIRAAYSTYRNAEDLISIGAFVKGSDPRIDQAIALIDKINKFLIQPLGKRTEFSQTIKRMAELIREWNFSVNEEDAQATPSPQVRK
jgi:flagellum-specific ATP synthase